MASLEHVTNFELRCVTADASLSIFTQCHNKRFQQTKEQFLSQEHPTLVNTNSNVMLLPVTLHDSEIKCIKHMSCLTLNSNNTRAFEHLFLFASYHMRQRKNLALSSSFPF